MKECGAHKAKTYLPELIELEPKGNRGAITENRVNPKSVIEGIAEFRSSPRETIEI
jgi:hypothetical protein